MYLTSDLLESEIRAASSLHFALWPGRRARKTTAQNEEGGFRSQLSSGNDFFFSPPLAS